eukprot:160240_1
MNKIDIACMAETKLKDITKLVKPPNQWKNYKLKPTSATNGFKKEKKGTSNGFINIINKRTLMTIKDYMYTINNPYINKYQIKDLRIVIIFIYIPPIKSTDKYRDPVRSKIIKQIYNDWDTLLSMAKRMNVMTISMGDMNGRMPHLTGDHASNYNGIQLLDP